MELFIDGTRAEEDFFPSGTLGDAIRDAQETRCPPGRIIVGFSCDGETVEGPQMSAALARQADTLDRLDLATSTKSDVVIETMDRAIEALDQAEGALQGIAELLIEGRPSEAITSLGECTKTWQQIHTAIIQSVALLELDPDAMPIKNATLTQAMAQPRSVLVQVKDALAAQDHVLLADILQYEFADAIDDWHAVLAGLRAAAAHDQSA